MQLGLLGRLAKANATMNLMIVTNAADLALFDRDIKSRGCGCIRRRQWGLIGIALGDELSAQGDKGSPLVLILNLRRKPLEKEVEGVLTMGGIAVVKRADDFVGLILGIRGFGQIVAPGSNRALTKSVPQRDDVVAVAGGGHGLLQACHEIVRDTGDSATQFGRLDAVEDGFEWNVLCQARRDESAIPHLFQCQQVIVIRVYTGVSRDGDVLINTEITKRSMDIAKIFTDDREELATGMGIANDGDDEPPGGEVGFDKSEILLVV